MSDDRTHKRIRSLKGWLEQQKKGRKKQEEEKKKITKTFPGVVRDRVVKVVSLLWLLLHGFRQ
jgi:hypothetical protein